MSRRFALAVAAALLLAWSDAGAGAEPARFGAVDLKRLSDADREPGQWFTGGRDGQGSYYSPLDQITDKNVNRLGFAWEFKTGTQRGLEATPIVVDGVMYTSGNWGEVFALDAETGRLLWRFDPENDGQAARFACCDVVNRGVAVRDGMVFVASLDGRLFGLDARTGEKKWSVDTLTDHKLPYTITGAPQLTRDLVVIGNGGADIGVGGVRGYVSAYDIESGQLKWRFYTVPAQGRADGPPELAAAEKTWDPDRNPKFQGGGTVWDGMAYDPELDLLYIGVGNSSPYQKYDRSPKGGDNLYLSSMVAIHAASGSMAWHYQTTPGDMWDYTATQKMILADLTIDGKKRQVVMQAPKNGFFYVLDRKTGKPISARNYVHVSWTSGLDANFRPKPNPGADYSTGPKLIYPSWAGGHDWQPMSFSRQTGLVYIPVHEVPMIVVDLQHNPGALVPHIDGTFSASMIIPDKDYRREDAEPVDGKLPAFPQLDPKTGKPILRGLLKAWDPVRQRTVWEQPTSEDYLMFDGGAMSTAGNLVFQGLADGEFRASAADSGRILKSLDTGTSIMAAPSTYTVNGVQYVAVMAGYGGAMMGTVFPAAAAPAQYLNEGRILVFKLGGGATVPKPPLREIPAFRPPPPQAVNAEAVRQGMKLYTANCSRCHQFGVGMVPDLRRLDDGIDEIDTFKSVVLGGALVPRGMGKFDDLLSEADAEAIHAYLVDEGRKAYQSEQGNH